VLGQVDFAHRGVNLIDGHGFSNPRGFAVDTSVTPNRIYVADANNKRVLGWSDVSSLANGAAADLVIGPPDFLSFGPDSPTAASVGFAAGLAVDGAGNLYVADEDNSRVLEFDSPFTTDTTADQVFGQGGSFTSGDCNHGGVSATSLCRPKDVTLDGSGNLYVADQGNSRVLEYDAPLSDHTADTVFGQSGDFTTSFCDGSDGTITTADSLCDPESVAVDSAGDLYIADGDDSRVLEYDTPLSTDTTADKVFGQGGDFTTVFCDGSPFTVSASSLCDPRGVAVDSSGNLYVADRGNTRVLEYDTPLSKDTTADTVFTTAACSAVSAESLCQPLDLAADTDGNLYVVDFERVLKYDAPLSTDVTADLELGQHDFTHATENLVDGSSLNSPQGVAFDTSVNPNRLYVADTFNNRVLAWADASAFENGDPADLVIGQPDIYSADCNAGNVSPSADTLCNPDGVAVDNSGNLYVADGDNNRVLEYNGPFTNDTTADKVLGQNDSFSTNDCGLSANTLCEPEAVAADSTGNVFVADFGNDRVVEYNTPLSTNTTADRVFGEPDLATDTGCGAVTAATLCRPIAVALDGLGNVYVADRDNNRVLEYNTPLTTDTTADRVFGRSDFLSSGCGGAPSATEICEPAGLAVDSLGNLYVTDDNNRVLEYDTPLSSDTTADQVFGESGSFTSSHCNIDGPPSADGLCGPAGLALDGADNLYVADESNNRVLEYDKPITAPTPVDAGLKVAPSSANFGKAAFGNAGAAGKSHTFKVTNLSKTNPIVVEDISVSGANASDFAVVSGGLTLSACTSSLPAKGKCAVTIQFTPGGLGLRAAVLTVAGNENNGSQNLTLSGLGLAPKLTIAPKSLSFASQGVSTTSPPKTVTLTNKSPVDLTITGVSSSDPQFAASGCVGVLAKNGGTCQISVNFTPSAIGKQTASLSITDNALKSPQTVNFKGSGK